jgi:hypothetical protein
MERTQTQEQGWSHALVVDGQAQHEKKSTKGLAGCERGGANGAMGGTEARPISFANRQPGRRARIVRALSRPRCARAESSRAVIGSRRRAVSENHASVRCQP